MNYQHEVILFPGAFLTYPRVFFSCCMKTVVATPSWHRPRAEPQEQHKESLKTKEAHSHQRFYLLPGELVLAAAALNLLGPGGGRRRPSGCPLLLLLEKASFLLPWKSSESSATATHPAISEHKEGVSTSDSTQPPFPPPTAAAWKAGAFIWHFLWLCLGGNPPCSSVQVAIADTAEVPSLLLDALSTTCNCFKGGSAPRCALHSPYSHSQLLFLCNFCSLATEQPCSASAFFPPLIFSW